MKYSKYLLIIMLIFSFALVSCKKTITEPKESSIVGSWQLYAAANNWVMTTTSDQLVKKPYSGDGQISSFGAYNSVFNGLLLLSSDPFIIAAVELEYGMFSTDAIVIDGTTGVGKVSNSNTDQTFEGIVNYTFDGTTLTITESILTNPQNAAETVTVSGSLSFVTASVPANTQTYVQVPGVWMFYYHFYYNGTVTTEFFDDNSTIRTRYIGQTPVDENGTWSVNDNILTLIITDGDNTYTEIYDYNLDNNTLMLSETFNICSGEEDSENCLNEYEHLFIIDIGSLTELEVEVKTIFNKTN